MKPKYIIPAILLSSGLVYAQDHSDTVEAAKLGVIEKLYNAGGDRFRKQLSARGLSEDEAENVLYEAIDAYALCVVLAAQAQAHEQGLSEEVILKGVGNKTRGKEESLILLSLDTDALDLKRAPCNAALSDKLSNAAQ